MSSHTARSISYQTFEGRETASFANGVATNGSSRPRSYGGSDSWLENLHRQHVSARNQVWTVLTWMRVGQSLSTWSTKCAYRDVADVLNSPRIIHTHTQMTTTHIHMHSTAACRRSTVKLAQEGACHVFQPLPQGWTWSRWYSNVMCPCLYLYIIYTLVEEAFDHEFCVMQTMSACNCLWVLERSAIVPVSEALGNTLNSKYQTTCCANGRAGANWRILIGNWRSCTNTTYLVCFKNLHTCTCVLFCLSLCCSIYIPPFVPLSRSDSHLPSFACARRLRSAIVWLPASSSSPVAYVCAYYALLNLISPPLTPLALRLARTQQHQPPSAQPPRAHHSQRASETRTSRCRQTAWRALHCRAPLRTSRQPE